MTLLRILLLTALLGFDGVAEGQEFSEADVSPDTVATSIGQVSSEISVQDEQESKTGPRKFSMLIGAGGAAFLGSIDYFFSEGLQTGFVTNGFLGYRFSRLRHSAGIFGRYGNISGRSARQLTNAFYQPVTALINSKSTTNHYFEMEAGIMLWEFVRFSAGKSWTFAELVDGNKNTITLGTVTGGLLFRTGPLRWFLDGTAYFDRRLEHFYFRPSAGLYIQIYMIRFY